MNKAVKYTLIGLGFLVLVFGIVVAIVAATFNPNDYKPMIVKLVQDKKQRTLNIEGDIKLAFWPKLGANLGKVSLSEHNSPKQFAAINSAKVSLALLPLLRKELVVDTVYVDGVTANIVRYKDGSTNFDDLLSKEEEESEQLKFDIDGVNVSNSAVNFTDEQAGASYAISKFNLKAGHVALAQPFDLATDFAVTASQPKINAAASIQGNFMVDPEAGHFAVKGLNANIDGDFATLSKAEIKLSGDIDAKPDTMELLVDSLKLALKGNMDGAAITAQLSAPNLNVQQNQVSGKEATISLSQEKAGDTVKANLVMADIQGSASAIKSSGIRGEISAKQGARNVEGSFSSPFSGNLDSKAFDLPSLTGKLDIKDPSLPNGGAKGGFALNLHADIKQERVNSDFNLDVDATKLKGKLAVSSFSKPNIQFNLNGDQLDLNKLLGKPSVKAGNEPSKAGTATASSKPVDLSVLNNLLMQGTVNIGSILYDKYRLAGLNLAVKADGKQLSVSPFAVKFDETQVKGSFGVSRFANPVYHFDIDMDKLDADKYITKSESTPATNPTKTAEPGKKADADTPVDLSALKQLNADGELRIGWLKLANVKSTNVRIKLQADDGVAQLAPFSANLYDGAMNGMLKVDARTTPSIAFKQNMTNIAIGPLLVDAINNDMLAGKGSLNLDVTTQGGTVGALKKALGGTAAVNLADGAVKGIDIAGTLRSVKDKINVLKSQQASVEGDKSKKTDFSEMTASFVIRNGVAHNEDLSMKAPLFRITGNGDIDIANETINYIAKPTVVASLKGQGGAGLEELNGLTVPVKLTGTFAKPSYAIDFAALATALAQKKVLDGIGGAKGEAVKNLMGGNKEEALKSLLGGNKKDAAKPAEMPAQTSPGSAAPAQPAPEKAPESAEAKAKKKLNKLLGL